MKTQYRHPATMSVYATIRHLHADRARWKRKNRIKQLKRTISILKHRLKDTEDTLRLTQKITKCFIVKPDHWHHLDENGNELTRKQWRIKTKKEKTQ